jgi:uncharacterized protein (DUF2062 family)
MPKNFIKRFSPKPERLKAHPYLKHFGNALQNPNLWHLNRRSAAGAVAVGLFCAWMPIPFQMILAAFIAIFFTVNLPISISLVWLSNPLTMPPLFYGAYRVGAWLLHEPPVHFHFHPSFHWLVDTFETIAPSLILGCFILGLLSSFLGYFIFRACWRFSVSKKWLNRKK